MAGELGFSTQSKVCRGSEIKFPGRQLSVIMLCVSGGILGRSRELQAMQAVLQRARDAPVALILDGEVGLGKTTLWRAAVEWASAAGFEVLTVTGAAAEMPLKWSGLAELLAGVDETALAGLSAHHRRALEAVATGADGPGGDERMIATAFRAVIEQMCSRRPVLLAVDDAQWLDEASKLVLGFAVRRVSGPLVVLAVYRRGEAGSHDQSWVAQRDPEALTRLTVEPMSLAAVHALLADRLDFTPPRPTMVRIHALSGGNPFYALELARGLCEHPGADPAVLPPTLAGLVRDRVGELDPVTEQVAVTAAVGDEPTVELIAAATGHSPVELVDILLPLERRGMLNFDGNRIRFAHPLIAAGITTNAGPAAQRRAHRSLADVVDHAEQHARHLALSTTHGDPDTLDALDRAAGIAGSRGAPATAADFVDLAIKLGGDTPTRRILLSGFRFRAGDISAASAAVASVAADEQGLMRAIAVGAIAAAHMYDNSYAEAAVLLTAAFDETESAPAVRAQFLLSLAIAEGMSGKFDASLRHAVDAVTFTRDHGLSNYESRALAVWVTLKCHQGHGFDVDDVNRAIELEEPDSEAPVLFSARAIGALLASWTGDLIRARELMNTVRRNLSERGAESDLVWVDSHRTFIDLWLGRYREASDTADEVLQRAQQLGGQNTAGDRRPVAGHGGCSLRPRR